MKSGMGRKNQVFSKPESRYAKSSKKPFLSESVGLAGFVMKFSDKLPSFLRPPVNEVVAGVQFSSLYELQTVHLGTLWALFGKTDYPRCQEVQPLDRIITSPNFQVELFPVLPMPRIWFISENDENLIQFQRDRFLFNWRKIGNDCQYPRYEFIRDSFFKNYEILEDFLKQEQIQPLRPELLELTYVNHIPFDDLVTDIAKILRDAKWEQGERFLPHPQNLGLSWQFALPELQGFMDVRLTAIQDRANGRDIFNLEITVRGQFSENDKSLMKDWYDQGRRWIVKAFEDLTTLEMQQVWGIQA